METKFEVYCGRLNNGCCFGSLKAVMKSLECFVKIEKTLEMRMGEVE